MTSSPGTFIAVVGPSGVGKDSLIRAAMMRLAGDPRIVFARRCVTRVSGDGEDHDTLDEAGFDRLVGDGAFMLWWQANGLRYGLPIVLLDRLQEGCAVVGNISREQVDALREVAPRTLIVHVTAPVVMLRERLLARGREALEDVDARIMRSLWRDSMVKADVRIDNSGELSEAVDQFLSIITSFRHAA